MRWTSCHAVWCGRHQGCVDISIKRFMPGFFAVRYGSVQTPRSNYFPWQYIKVATRDVIAVRRLGSVIGLAAYRYKGRQLKTWTVQNSNMGILLLFLQFQTFFRRKLSKLDFDLHFCIMTSVLDFSNPPFYG